MATLYGIRNCDTVRKARRWLDDRGVRHGFHDYKTAGIEAPTLRRWIDALGWEALLNRSGTTFRALPAGEKLDLDEEKAIALMLASPSMIKRPVLEAGEVLLVGFRPDVYGAAGLDR